MSEQTPPADQPTPTTPEAASTPAGTDGTPPPPPPSEPTTAETPATPPPAKKSRKGVLIGLVAGLVVLALIGGALAVFLVTRGPDKHTLTVPATAGGLKRDTAKEKELQQQLDAAEQQFETQFKNVTYTKSGVYNLTDAKRGPKGALVFLGAKVELREKNPTTFVTALRKQATKNGFKVSSIGTGDAGGKAICAEQSAGQKVAICAWATADSGGELVPTVAGWDTKSLSKVMTSMRADIEKSE